MNRRPIKSYGRLSLALGVVLALCSLAPAQQYDRDNAAELYEKARAAMGRLTPEQWDHLYMVLPGDRRIAPTDEVRALLRDLQPAIELARRASQRDHNDLGLDYSQGFDLLLPHLGQNRSLSRLMAADVMVRMHDGDAHGAADRLAGLYRMGEHTAQDDIVISSLVGNALFNIADQVAAFGLDRGVFSPEQGEVLLKAVQQIHTDDPMHIRGGIANEKVIMLDWMSKKYSGEGGGEQIVADLGAWTSPSMMMQLELASMSPQQLAFSLDEAGEAFDRVLEIFDMPDREAARVEIALLEEEVARGDHGAIAAMLMPAFGRIFENSLKLEDALNERETVLAALASGAASASELANAAVWYLEAASTFEKLPAQTRNDITLCAAHPQEAVSESLDAALGTASTIIDTLREGSLIGRCDFTITDQRRPAIGLTHVRSMRELFQLLHADTIRLMQKGEFQEALNRLKISYRMIAHLTQDKAIISSLVSHVVFRQTSDLLESLLNAHELNPPQLAGVRSTVLRLRLNDPFEYMNGIKAHRDELIPWLQRRPDFETKRRLRHLVGRWNAEQLLFVAALQEARPHTMVEDTVTHDYAWLSDVMFVDQLPVIASQAKAIQEELAEEQYDIFAERTAPVIGQVDQWRSVAPSDVQDVLKWLQPPTTTADNADAVESPR